MKILTVGNGKLAYALKINKIKILTTLKPLTTLNLTTTTIITIMTVNSINNKSNNRLKNIEAYHNIFNRVCIHKLNSRNKERILGSS